MQFKKTPKNRRSKASQKPKEKFSFTWMSTQHGKEPCTVHRYFVLYSNMAPLNPDQQLQLEVEQDFMATLSEYERKEYTYFKSNVRFLLFIGEVALLFAGTQCKFIITKFSTPKF